LVRDAVVVLRLSDSRLVGHVAVILQAGIGGSPTTTGLRTLKIAGIELVELAVPEAAGAPFLGTIYRVENRAWEVRRRTPEETSAEIFPDLVNIA
jgi:hypothetical protein